MKNIFKYAFGTFMIVTVISYLYVNYFPNQLLDESKQKDTTFIKDKFIKSHSLIYMSCQGKEFADFLVACSVVERAMRDGQYVLQAKSMLWNDWYRQRISR